MKNFIANVGLPERDGICFDWMTIYTMNIHKCQVILENILIFMQILHKYRLAEMLRNGKRASDLLAEAICDGMMRRKSLVRVEYTDLRTKDIQA